MKGKHIYAMSCSDGERERHYILHDSGLKHGQSVWNKACSIVGHAASAVNKTTWRPPWPDSELTTATANTTPAQAGTIPTALPLLTKWAGRSNPATMFTTSTVSKLTTVTPTSLSFRLPPMPKSTTNNFQIQTVGGRNAAQSCKLY